MKSIVIGMIKTKQYYMGLDSCWGGIWLDGNITYSSNSDYSGKLYYRYDVEEDSILCETNDFHKVLEINEIVQVQDKEYAIKKVKHGSDGTMYYYVEVEREDEQSKFEAQKEVEKRTIFLEGRKQMKEEIRKEEEKLAKLKIKTIDELTPQKKSFLHRIFG